MSSGNHGRRPVPQHLLGTVADWTFDPDALGETLRKERQAREDALHAESVSDKVVDITTRRDHTVVAGKKSRAA